MVEGSCKLMIQLVAGKYFVGNPHQVDIPACLDLVGGSRV